MKTSPRARRTTLGTAAGGGAVLVVLAVLRIAGAQEQDDLASRKFFAPLDVPLVNVEVMVTESEGNPVPGLTVDDFEVYEDDEPVAVSHFYAAPTLVVAEEGGARLEGEDEPVEEQASLYLVLYFDDYLIHPKNRSAILRHLRRFLERPLPPMTKLMLVYFDGRLQLRSDFTDDPNTLLPELDRLEGAVPLNFAMESELLMRKMQNVVYGDTMAFLAASSGTVQEDPFRPFEYLTEARFLAGATHDRIRNDLDALERYVGFLAGLSGRKAILWVGTGFETRTGESLFSAWAQLFPYAARQSRFEPTFEARKYDTMRYLRELVNFANTHRVSFYTLSALAVGAAAETSSEFRDLSTLESRGVLSVFTQEESLNFMSEFSGGRTLTDNTGLDEQLGRVCEELASYYSLGYQPPNHGDGRFHRIKVNVKRKGFLLRYRQGYRDAGEADGVSDRTLAAAMFGVAENPMGIAAECLEQELRSDDNFLVPLMVRIPIGELVLMPRGESHTGVVSVHTAARDDQQRLSKVHGRQFPIDVPNDQLTIAVEREAGFVIGMVMRTGPHRIAVTVRDERSKMESTTFVEVAVGEADGDHGR